MLTTNVNIGSISDLNCSPRKVKTYGLLTNFVANFLAPSSMSHNV